MHLFIFRKIAVHRRSRNFRRAVHTHGATGRPSLEIGRSKGDQAPGCDRAMTQSLTVDVVQTSMFGDSGHLQKWSHRVLRRGLPAQTIGAESDTESELAIDSCLVSRLKTAIGVGIFRVVQHGER